MLTDLSFLNEGSTWLPPTEVDRIERYQKNKDLFGNKQDRVYEEQFKRIERVVGNFGNVVSYPVIVNYQRLITTKIVDLILSESPDFKSSSQELIDNLLMESDLYNVLYKVAIDISRYGDGLFYIYNDETMKIGYTQPEFWFPVVDPFNTSKIINHVLAYPVEDGVDDQGKKRSKLVVQVHYKGFYELRQYQLTSSYGIVSYIGKLLSTDIVPTGLTDFAIVHIPNLQTSDSIFGHDDYTPVDSIISEILVRIGQISKILDKHASPTVQGPLSALDQDPNTGEWHFKAGGYIALGSSDDVKAEYMTWEGQLEAAFKELETLTNTLYMVSEIGATYMGKADSTGAVSSGTALRLKLITPQMKARRIKMNFDPNIKKAIKLATSVPDVDITWYDGVPNDPMEEAQIMDIRTGRKATISQKEALIRLDDLSESEAQIIIDDMHEDEENATSYVNKGVSEGGQTGEHLQGNNER